MASEFELIGDIRGRGVLLGVEFVTDRDKKTPANTEVGKIASLCLEHGLIFQLRGTQGDLNVIRLVPPMIATDAAVDRAMSIMRAATALVSRGRRSVSRAAEGARNSTCERPQAVELAQGRFEEVTEIDDFVTALVQEPQPAMVVRQSLRCVASER